MNVNSTAPRKLTCSRWPAQLLQTDRRAGRCGFWPSTWSSWPMSTRSPTRPCARPLKKNDLNPHRRKMWCMAGKPSAEFVYPMEDVLAVYHRLNDPKRPVVCVDETFKQLIGETREPLPMRPGTMARYDYVYTRNGVASLFLACEPLAGWRHIAVTEHRRRTDWAGFIRALLEGRYRAAEKLVLIMDQLNTHSPASLYEAFPPEKAKRLAARLAMHHTPKHGSWLNQAEIELSFLARQCLSHRPSGHPEASDRRLGGEAQRPQASDHVAVHNPGRPHQTPKPLPITSALIQP